MIENIVQQLTAIVATMLTILSGLSGLVTDNMKFGATIPVTVALFETSLATKITSSATSMTLVSGTDKAGNSLAGYMCFTIDEGSASEEFVCGTASSTSVSSMLRGISPTNGATEVATLKKEHRRGASVKMTDHPQIAIISRILNGDDTIPNTLSYATSSTSSMVYDYQIPNKSYVDSVAYAGAPNISTTTKGIGELSTREELASSTVLGATGTYLMPHNQLFSSTTVSTTTIPYTNASGKLSQGFLDLTANWAFSGNTTLATTTMTSSTASRLTVTGTSTLATTTMSSSTITGNLSVGGTTALSASTTVNNKTILTDFGSTTTNYVDNTAYHATTSLIVTALFYPSAQPNFLVGYTDNNASPSTKAAQVSSASTNTYFSITFPVIKGDYFKVDADGGTTNLVINVTPFGN